MDYLSDLTAQCGAQHLPNVPTKRIVLYNAGAIKLGVCPRDEQLNHVQYPCSWIIQVSSVKNELAIIIYRDGRELARIVPTNGPEANTFTIETML